MISYSQKDGLRNKDKKCELIAITHGVRVWIFRVRHFKFGMRRTALEKFFFWYDFHKV